MNNILDPNGNKNNFTFLASVIAVLCEKAPITIDLKDIERYWSGEISKLQYDLIADTNTQQGTVTFSLRKDDKSLDTH